MYDIVNDPYETKNLIDLPEYETVADEMQGYYLDWNAKYHDFGMDPINWENCTPAYSLQLLNWLKLEKPEVIDQMKQGIEPGFSKYNKAFKSSKNQN